MRLFPLAGALALLTLVTACHQASPLRPVTGMERQAETVGARSVASRLLVKWKDPAAAESILEKLGAAHQAVDGLNVDVVDLPSGVSAEDFQSAAGDRLAYAEPDYIMHTYTVPNDPLFSRQYALKKVQAPEAWARQKGDSRVKIAIVDTGADTNHPDLKEQIAGTYNAIGWRAKLGVGSVRDDNGHGTHCAGIAAAAMDNQEGICGMAPGCKLLVVKALGEDGSGATSDIARGIHWAVAHGASVISLSMGAEGDAQAMRDAVASALHEGVVVVAAMGNEGKLLKNYPAAYPGVIAVGATNAEDRLSSYSTRGSWISVSAPGTAILSTTPTYPVFLTQEAGLEATYGKLSGTSMATPLVAGLAALVRSQHPSWTPAQVKKAIEDSADSLGDRFNANTGHGRVNALEAVR